MAGINDQKAKVLPSSFSLIISYSISAIFRCCTYHPDTVPVISRLAKNAFHVTRERGGMLDQPFRLGHVADSWAGLSISTCRDAADKKKSTARSRGS